MNVFCMCCFDVGSARAVGLAAYIADSDLLVEHSCLHLFSALKQAFVLWLFWLLYDFALSLFWLFLCPWEKE